MSAADDAAAARRIQAFREKLILDGDKLDASLRGRVTGARTVRTMDGASSLVLTIDDDDLQVLGSGLLSRQGKPTKRAKRAGLEEAAWDRVAVARMTLDGWFTRLAGYDFHIAAKGSSLELTFEDEIAWLMRRQRDAIVSSRRTAGHKGGEMSRAEFIAMLLGISTKRQVGYVHYFSPERSVLQQVRKPTKKENANLEKAISSGELKHLTMMGLPVGSAESKNLEKGLARADKDHAGERATKALIVAGIVEAPRWANPEGGDASSVGVLQLLSSHLGGSTSTRGGRRDVDLVCHLFLTQGFTGQGGAIQLAAAHPEWTVGQVAQAVQGSAFPDRYDVWSKEADQILDAWGGASQIVTTHERYSYRAGGRRDGEQHNYWDDAGDLADEVNWRLYADSNTLYYVSDEWLFTRQPVYFIDRDTLTGGILSIEASADNSPSYVSEIVVEALAPGWQRTPGAVVQISDELGPLAGRWLIYSDEHDRATDQATVTLHRPEPKLKEPASKARAPITLTETTAESGSARDRIVQAALKAYRLDRKTNYLLYKQVRPMPSGLFPRGSQTPTGIYTGPTLYTDCSGFATLCYKAAGQPDPNGVNYNGNGYTGTLAANGTRTNDPQPGDLAFYGSGPPWGHVGVYIGGGEVVEFGGDPGPQRIKANYRSDGPHYYTFELTD